MKHFFKKGDIIIVVCAVVLCLILFGVKTALSSGGDIVARVYENGRVTHEIKLKDVTESYEIEINGGRLLVESTGVAYIDASCKDKTCQKSGKLKRAGDTAACVPNKTVVVLVGEKNKSDIDIMTY